MFKRSSLVCSAVLLLVALAACDNSTGPSSGLSKADANQLAADMDAVSTLGTADFGFGSSFSVGVDGGGSVGSISAAPFTFENSFTVTRQCPKGGQVVIAGTIAGAGDRATRSLTVETNATRTDANCAFQTRNGVLTLNGNPDLDYTANLNIVNGAPSGLQTQSHKGSFTWSRDGGPATTCDVDVTSSFDPATHTVTVKGVFCGHTVDVTRTRGR